MLGYITLVWIVIFCCLSTQQNAEVADNESIPLVPLIPLMPSHPIQVRGKNRNIWRFFLFSFFFFFGLLSSFVLAVYIHRKHVLAFLTFVPIPAF